MELAQQVIKNSFFRFSSDIIQRIGGLIFTIILARFLLPASFGTYNLVLSIALIFMTFSNEGLNKTFLRYISLALGKNNKKRAASYFKYLIKVKFLVSALVSLLLIFLAYPLSNYIFKKPALFLPLLFASIYIFIFSFEIFLSYTFFAVKKVKYIAVKDIIYQTIRILLTLIVFLLIASSYYIAGIFAALIISSLVVLIIILYYIKKLIPFIFEKSPELDKKHKKRILKFLTYITIGAISATFFAYIDIIMLALLIKDYSFVGYYRAAFILAFSISGILGLTGILLTVFTQIKKQELEQAFNQVFKYLMILAIPAAFGLSFLGKYFIEFIYGSQYMPSIAPLYVISFIVILGVAVTPYLNLFSAEEKPKAYTPLLLFIIILNIILNYIFITSLSKYSLLLATTGAAIATIIAWTAYAVGLGYLTKKILNIKTKLQNTIKPLIASFFMILMLWFLTKIFSNLNIFNGLILMLIGAIIYFAVMFLIKGLTKEDIKILKEAFF